MRRHRARRPVAWRWPNGFLPQAAAVRWRYRARCPGSAADTARPWWSQGCRAPRSEPGRCRPPARAAPRAGRLRPARRPRSRRQECRRTRPAVRESGPAVRPDGIAPPRLRIARVCCPVLSLVGSAQGGWRGAVLSIAASGRHPWLLRHCAVPSVPSPRSGIGPCDHETLFYPVNPGTPGPLGAPTPCYPSRS